MVGCMGITISKPSMSQVVPEPVWPDACIIGVATSVSPLDHHHLNFKLSYLVPRTMQTTFAWLLVNIRNHLKPLI